MPVIISAAPAHISECAPWQTPSALKQSKVDGLLRF